ncbi:MAG: hypothetical protein KKD99_06345 [Proteobacteria bacterium]|nr:hypothetical protein [Pseudomonadota bacterium]MBU4356340.1 hypothetical protein [Pseudomonadota bacterium]MBU4448187.1 hypothetical protein [Pseudomonadota bacterium]
MQEGEVDETCIMGSKPGKLGRGADGNWLLEKPKWEDGKMKKKVMLVALLCVLGMATLSIGNANAAIGTYTCSVVAAGANYWGYYAVTLTDNNGAFTNLVCFIPVDPVNAPGMEKAQYAAALTAFANSTNVVAFMDTSSTAIFQLYASK